MSFSFANVALIRTATQLASGMAGRMGEAMGFDEILRGEPTTAEIGLVQCKRIPA